MSVNAEKGVKMNNIENYGSVNVNTNYRKVNKNPNFKAFNLLDTGKKTLERAQRIIEKGPTNSSEKKLFDEVVELLNIIRAIKPLANVTKFYDIVVGESSVGLKEAFCEEPIVKCHDILYPEGKKIFVKRSGQKQFVAELKDEATAKKFEGEIDSEKFHDLLEELEENAQTRVDYAKKTLKELLDNDIKIV